MPAIIGLIGVAVAVIAGFIMEGGHLMVLMQPAEFLIIGGAAIGGLLVGTPVKYVKMVIAQLTGIMKGGLGKKDYIGLLVMMDEFFTVPARKG